MLAGIFFRKDIMIELVLKVHFDTYLLDFHYQQCKASFIAIAIMSADKHLCQLLKELLR